jgi:RNA polymerase sigma-B factor
VTEDALLDRLAATPYDDPAYGSLREQVVEANLPLVRYLARRLTSDDTVLEDLVQVGSVGLLKAVDRFDPSLGHAFGSYAAPVIIGEIKRYLRDSGRLVRAPRKAFELQSAVAHARDELSQELGRPPTLSEVAERVGASAEEVVETLEVIRGREHQPLDRLQEGEAGAPMQHLVAIDEPGYDSAEIRADLRAALATLDETEQRVIMLRFVEGRTQREIAELVGVSQMQISRLIQRSLMRMRGALDE